MYLYATAQYLKYRWKAKGRHGVHSPFVYDFIERVLHDFEVIPKEYIVSCPALPLRFENILSRTAAYYQYREILFLPTDRDGMMASKAGMVLLDETVPQQWLHLLDKYRSVIQNECIVVALGIHKTPSHSLAWKTLCNEPAVRMTIDLYGIGILLFREEFNEKQHFVLKY